MNFKELCNSASQLGFERNGHLGYQIFESLPTLSKEEQIQLSCVIAPMFATNNKVSGFKKYKQHLETSFMRKLFGLTERNGSVLAITHPDRLSGYNKNKEMVSQWSLSFEFTKYLEQQFIKHNRQFGLILLYEALGHRCGDLAVNGLDSIDHMYEYYAKSRKIARKIKCAKQMFVLYFWTGCYEYKLGLLDDAQISMKKFHSLFKKLHSKSRVFYGDKLKVSLNVLNKCTDSASFKSYCRSEMKSANNKIKKIFTEFI